MTNSGKTYTIQGSATDGGILPRALDVIFNSIGNQQWDTMIFRPEMLCSVSKLTLEEMGKEEKIKERVMKMATDEVCCNFICQITYFASRQVNVICLLYILQTSNNIN